MTTAQLTQLQDETRRKLVVTCDEFHAHNIQRGCLKGPPDAVSLYLVIDELLELRHTLSALTHRWDHE